MIGISSAELKTIFLAFFSLMSDPPSGPRVGFLGRLDVILRLDGDALADGRGQGFELGQAEDLDDGAGDGRVDDRGGQAPQLVLDGDLRGVDRPDIELAVEGEILRPPVAVDDDRPAQLEAFGDVDGFDERRVDDDDAVGGVDPALVVDLLVVDADEGDDGRAPSLDAELGVGLDPVAFLGDGVGEDLGGDDGALAAAAVKTDFDHVRLLAVK